MVAVEDLSLATAIREGRLAQFVRQDETRLTWHRAPYSALTMSSTIFLASPNSIIVPDL
jgi:hypothetical protein